MGRVVEQLACWHLQRAGLIHLAHNVQYKQGELDLVMQDRDTIVFVEVRYRRNTYFGSGTDTIDRHKQGKLWRCAQLYLVQNAYLAESPCRFDVIAASGTPPKLTWIKNAFFDIT